MNNYIVTFEYRVMVTAFAILAMFFIFQIFVQILANSIDITDVTMACVDGVTKLRISIPEDFKSFFKDGGS